MMKQKLKDKLSHFQTGFNKYRHRLRAIFERIAEFSQPIREKLYHFKEQLDTKTHPLRASFWRKMAQWSQKWADFSQQKASKLNDSTEYLLPSLGTKPAIVESSNVETHIETKQSLPAPLIKILKKWLDEFIKLRKLFEQFTQRQTNTDEKLAQLINQQTLIDEKMVQLINWRNEISQKPIADSDPSPPSEPPSPNVEPSQSVEEHITVEMGNELRLYLEQQTIWDEQLWLALWRGDPTPCQLAERLLTEYSPLTNSDREIYVGIMDWLTKASKKHKIQFIIPELGEECDFTQHEIIEQRPVKGPVNRVIEIKQPGLRCDDNVPLKAQVISS